METITKNLMYIPAFFAGLVSADQDTITALIILMTIDIITGIIKSGKTKGWASIKSTILAAGLLSKLVLLLVPMIVAYTGKGIGVDMVFLVKGTLTVLILSEAYSALGNIQAIRTGKEVPEFDAVAVLLKSIRKSLLKLLNKSINK